MTETLFALQHFSYGCSEPQCNFIYTKDEIEGDELKQYLQNHEYVGTKPSVYPIESKIWTIDEILNINKIEGWTPQFFLHYNGFVFEEAIDLFELFGTPKKPYQNLHEHDLKTKKDELLSIFNKLSFDELELLVYRTLRRGLTNWDAIEVFSIGCYHNSKEIMRDQIVQDCLSRKK